MANLKDSLHDHKKIVTLSASQIDFLQRIHIQTQATLERLQEQIAGEYLHDLAVRQFDMDPKKDFNFDYHPEKEYENLTITERINRK